MNFTHLLKAKNSDPNQKLLQKAEYFLIIFCLSDDMSEYVLEEVGVALQMSRNALCWVVQRHHLEIAPKGSALREIYNVLIKNPTASNIDHSFVACISKSDFISNDPTKAKLYPLYLLLEVDHKARKIKLKQTVAQAMKNFESTPFIDKIQDSIKILPLFKLVTRYVSPAQ